MEKEQKATQIKKLYLIKADDVEKLETGDDATHITNIRLKPGGRIVQIDDSPEGRGVLTSNIRRIVGNKASTRLITGKTEV